MAGVVSKWLVRASVVLFAGMPVYAAGDAPQAHQPLAQSGVTDSISSSLAEPAYLLLAQAQPASPRSSGSIVEVPLPAVAGYWLTAVRTPEGRVVLDGYLPNQALRTELAAEPDVDPAGIELAGGEPDGFETALAFGLGQLARMSEGRFSLRSTVLALSGTAASPEDQAVLAEPGIPAGFVLARNEILPPPDAPTDDGASVDAVETPAAAEETPAATAETPADAVTASTEPAASNEPEVSAPEPVASGATATAPPPPAADPYVWSAGKGPDGVVTLSGHIPGEPLRRILMLRAGEGAVDTTQFATGAPEGFILDTRAAMDVLARLSAGEVAFDGTRWSASGTLAEGADEAALATALAEAATPAADWSLELSEPSLPLPPASEPLPASAGEPIETPEAPAAEVLACEGQLAAFSQDNPILFRSGSAAIAETSGPALADLAAMVSACPHLPIYIEGHTDADGAADANLALSVARAEAVVAALVDLGVASSRLYAIGYGEGAPIAANDTAQGKQLNRRIVVSLDPPED
jgi:outer membrane protein OmpA-like peptidoglycan-associated protein